MAVVLDQQHHGFKSFVVGGRPPRTRTRTRCTGLLQSYSHHFFHDHTIPEFKFFQTTNTNYLAHSHSSSSSSSSLKKTFNDIDQVANTIHRSFSTPCLPLISSISYSSTRLLEEDDHDRQLFDIDANNNKNSNNPRIIEIINGGHGDPRTRALVVEVAIAMASGVILVPVSSGLSGAYFICGRNINNDSNYNIAVVKPIDEEPLAFINNPKGFPAAAAASSGQLPAIKRSIRIGETGLRELAAYLLDHGGFAGVPPTALVKISHFAFHVVNNNNSNNNSELAKYSTPPPPPPPPPKKKIAASLQRFVDHDSDAGDLGPCGFSVSSIHCIGILDIRLLNLDRHAGNMLVKRYNRRDGGGEHENNYVVGAAELVPIDHGLCLPESLEDPYFEWLHWPQSSLPFSDSEVKYVSNLDPVKDAQLLRKELPSIRESAIRILVLCTIFLKRAVAAGLCLADIGEMMTREIRGGSEENFSVLDSLCLNAKGMVISSMLLNDRNDINDNQGEEEEESTKMFQFDDEFNIKDSSSTQALDLPQLLKGTTDPVIGKTSRIARFSSERSMTGSSDTDLIMSPPLPPPPPPNIYKKNTGNIDSDSPGGGAQEYKAVEGLTRRSMRYYSMSNQNYENGGIFFGEFSEEEWELFLENFEKLLPSVF